VKAAMVGDELRTTYTASIDTIPQLSSLCC